MKIKFLLSTQRSGSHFLKSFLEQRFPSAVCSGEVLGPPDEDSVGHAQLAHPGVSYFWPWYEAQVKAGRISAAPNGRISAFRQFLHSLEPAVGHRDLVVDIKYNSIRTLSGFWDTEVVSNDFVTFVKDAGFPVLNLLRRNLLKVIISNHLARTTGIWHRTQDLGPVDSLPKLHLPPKALLSDIRYATRVVDAYQSVFSGCAGYEEIFYEDVVQESRQPHGGRSLRGLERFIGQPARAIAPETCFRKTTPDDLAEVVENWSDIVRVLAHTEFGWMTQQPMRAAA